MSRRAELFVREFSNGEAAHLLHQTRRGKNAVVRHRAMILFASFEGQSVSQISSMFQASAKHVAALVHAFNEQGFAALDPRWGGGRPRRIDLDARSEIVKVAVGVENPDLITRQVRGTRGSDRPADPAGGHLGDAPAAGLGPRRSESRAQSRDAAARGCRGRRRFEASGRDVVDRG